MSEEIKTLIKNHSPLLEEDSDVFRELETFFGKDAKIGMHRDDLSKFLQDNRTYQVVRVSGKSYKDCVYEFVDNYPEMMDAIGMLRYYFKVEAVSCGENPGCFNKASNWRNDSS